MGFMMFLNESITGMHLSAEEIPLRYKMIMISN